ncbi:hypothetical protein BDP27DRAFT_1359215 [Rhodocollybia butyracea]|uniref:Uncharacterized protein n=1 Tax=Rhodocollybia butyracea TaxID=206335 RepID=A0A9P5UDC1_9AGAR|nr:hypothetical protein BDP27DRAFT_1359215 [Rhodocollybia butyracea]
MMLEAKSVVDAPPSYPPEEAEVLSGKELPIESEDTSSSTTYPPVDIRSATYTEDKERHFRDLAVQLHGSIGTYTTARSENRDEEMMKRNQGNVFRLMNEVADAAPDPEVKAHYRDKATKFSKASSMNEKDRILQDIGRGLIIMISAPFAIAAAALFVSGTLIQGVGRLLKEVALVHPIMRKWLKKRKHAEWKLK